MQVIMDQVLLEWGGGDSVLLARIRDVEGCWLSGKEVYRKLCPSTPRSTWQKHTHGGKHTF